MVTRLGRQLAPSSVQVIHGLVAAIFKAAVRDRLVSSSSCEGTTLPKKLPSEVVPLDTSTVQALAEAVPDRYRALLILDVGTGLRQGEAFGVAKQYLDLERGLIPVEQQVILLPGRDPFLAPPKTPASHRTVPLPDVVVAALHEHLQKYPVTHPDGLVFTDDEGKAIRRTRFSREIWRPAVAKAGAKPGTGFHDLRHHYACLLIRHGESIKTVQRGHAAAAETLDIYAHPWPDAEDRTHTAIDSVLGSGSDHSASRLHAPHSRPRALLDDHHLACLQPRAPQARHKDDH